MKFLLVILLLIPTISALNVSVDYDHIIQTGKEFKVDISCDDDSIFDIKIDIIGDDKRISKILDDDKFKSTMYYIDGFSDDESYRLITYDYIGTAYMTIKLRDTSDKVSTFGPYEIKIDEEINEQDDEDYEIIEEEPKIKNFSSSISSPTILETISLNPKTIKKEKSNVLLGKGLIKYSLGIFCLILFFFYIKKPNKEENEFRRSSKTKDCRYDDNRGHGETERTPY